MVNIENYNSILAELPSHVRLVVVSKTKPVQDIEMLYRHGHRCFGENKAQELKEKHQQLPPDIEWHFIGHLQSNKIKYIAPFVSLIHSIDSLKLLEEVNKYAFKNDRIIPCLLQFHIAKEESKFGFDLHECEEMLSSENFAKLKNITLHGVMGMATFTENREQIRSEFRQLYTAFTQLKEKFFKNVPDFKEISMGMTDDFLIAVEEKSTMVRIGSAIFGARDYGTK
jgi:pyridoxal phosphate enzyme (YggS family)